MKFLCCDCESLFCEPLSKIEARGESGQFVTRLHYEQIEANHLG